MDHSSLNESNSTVPEGKDIVRSEGKGKREGMGLEPRNHGSFDQKKALELLLKYPKNISHICRLMGVARNTWVYHENTFPEFALAVQEIEEAHCDDLEATMLELGKAKSSFNFNDRIAYLRAHRSHLYNPTKKIIVEGYSMNGKEKAARLGAIETVIDAEVVKTYTTRKERLEAKRQEQLGGGDGQAGEKGGGGG